MVEWKKKSRRKATGGINNSVNAKTKSLSDRGGTFSKTVVDDNQKIYSGIGKRDYLLVVVPVVVLVGTMMISLFATGNGSLIRGDGTASVFYAVLASIAVLAVMVRLRPKDQRPPIEKTIYSGIGEFMEVGILLALALTLGALCKDMGTGYYIAGLAQGNVPTFLMPLIFFFVSCLISFSTGTSYGTFSIMVPLAVPVAEAMGIPLPLMFAACISGGVFGDNTSPFSDTSVITAISSRIPVVTHVKTQLPYTLISASVAAVLFVIAGLVA